MTDYYVDLDNPGAWNSRTGLNHAGNQWLGLSGLQKAADTVTAGNTIHIKGTVVCTNLRSANYDNFGNTGGFIIGEQVTWDSGSSNGVVSEHANTEDAGAMVIEVITGTLADNDSLTGATSGETCDVAGVPTTKATGLDIDTNAGSIADGVIKFVGVNSSWVNDETRCKLDGNAGAVAGCNDIVDLALCDILFENMEVDDSDMHGFGNDGGGRGTFINCWAHDCDQYGFFGSNQGVYVRCISNNNSYGFYGAPYMRCFMCIAHNNSTQGFYLNSGGSVTGSIAAENTTAGFLMGAGTQLLFSTADENVDGVSCISLGALVMFSRITNNSDDGLYVTSGDSVYEDWNLFYGNTGDDYDDAAGAGLIIKGGNSKIDSTGDGYTDQTNHDFNLTDSADYRREVIAFPKWDGTSP